MGREVIVWISKMLLDSVLQREIMDLIEKKRKEEMRNDETTKHDNHARSERENEK